MNRWKISAEKWKLKKNQMYKLKLKSTISEMKFIGLAQQQIGDDQRKCQ